jgi:hypothetical protein
MKKRTNNSSSPAQVKHPSQNPSSTKIESNFTTFSKSFFEIFTEKDKRESEIYNEIQCIDASKGHKAL